MLFFPQLTFRKFTNSTITWPNPPVLSQHMCPSLGTSVVFKEEEKFQTWDLHGAWEKVGNLNQKISRAPKCVSYPQIRTYSMHATVLGLSNFFSCLQKAHRVFFSFPFAVRVIWCAAASNWQCVLSDWKASMVSILAPLMEVSVCNIDLMPVHAALLSLLSSP